MSINETVLEMHFHRSILAVIQKKLGLGQNGLMNFYKYSPQKEVFIGFDQAYICSQLPEQAMFNHLKAAASANSFNLGPVFVGLFLQFKVVLPFSNKSKHTPPQISSAPFYRSALSTQQNINTGQAQHELLHMLSANQGAFVYYACPMLFDRAELYSPPNLDQLRLVDVKSSAGPYLDNKKHFIFFDTTTSVPIWKSEPKEGIAIHPEDLAAIIQDYVGTTNTEKSATAMLNLMQQAMDLRAVADIKGDSLELLEESFTLLEIWPNNENDQSVVA